MSVKVGIIGCGGIAEGKHLPALSQIEEVELVAFCDIEVKKAEKDNKEYGSVNAKVFEDYNKMLHSVELDVVHVLTPNNVHAEISIAAMQAQEIK